MQNVHAFSFVIFFVIFDSAFEATAQSFGGWQQCLGSYYFVSADTRNYQESQTYCQNMLRPSYLANFTLVHAQNIITSCAHLNLSNSMYWLDYPNGLRQQVGKCRVFYKKGSNVVVYLQSCTNIAHPLCEMSRMPAKPVGLPSQVTVVQSSWQACNGKCYLFGAGNVTFSAVNSYCRSMSTNSQPVTFGSKLEGSVTTELSTCRLKTVDGHTYWINKHSVQNRTDPDCRTVTFSGTAVHFKTTPCLSSSKQFCETSNTSFCKTSNKTDGIAKDWVSVSGQRPSYKVSSGTFGYCESQNHCKASVKAQIAREGNYTAMGLLAVELGIKGREKLDFWVYSPGILCPSSLGNGSVMRYTGPLVHMVECRNATEKYRVLCEKNTAVPTVLPVNPSGRKHTSPTTSETTTHTRTRSRTTSQTTTQTNTSSTTTTQTTTQTNTPSTTTSITTTRTSTPSTTTSKPTTQTSTPSTTTSITTTQTSTPSTTTSKPTTQTSTPSTTTSITTTQTSTPSTTMSKPTTQTSTPSTTTSITTTQTSTPSTTTSKPTTQTNTPSMTTSQTTTQTSTPSTTTSSAAKPLTTLSTNLTTSPLTLSPRNDATSMGCTWTRIGQEEYYVNYDRGSYIMADRYCREKLNASLVMFLSPIKYFSILSQIALKNSSFWVGAHSMDQTGLPAACLSYIVKNMTMTTLPCHFKKFSVCSRILGGDISKVLEDPGFRQMIREMTVLRNETKKSIRQLTCAEDRRTSARAAGGVGVFIVCAVVTLLFMSDCSGIKSDFFNRKKKAQ